MESTPFDIEVAVDPEMLGKVFEETGHGETRQRRFTTRLGLSCGSCAAKPSKATLKIRKQD